MHKRKVQTRNICESLNILYLQSYDPLRGALIGHQSETAMNANECQRSAARTISNTSMTWGGGGIQHWTLLACAIHNLDDLHSFAVRGHSGGIYDWCVEYQSIRGRHTFIHQKRDAYVICYLLYNLLFSITVNICEIKINIYYSRNILNEEEKNGTKKSATVCTAINNSSRFCLRCANEVRHVARKRPQRPPRQPCAQRVCRVEYATATAAAATKAAHELAGRGLHSSRELPWRPRMIAGNDVTSLHRQLRWGGGKGGGVAYIHTYI